MAKKGRAEVVIDRIKRIYLGGITIPVVNGVFGDLIPNSRRTLRQGDCPSSVWFSYGVDPLLTFLHNRLQGLLIHQSPRSGPTLQGESTLPPHETSYTVVGFFDDVKTAITSLEEFVTVVFASSTTAMIQWTVVTIQLDFITPQKGQNAYFLFLKIERDKQTNNFSCHISNGTQISTKLC